MSRKQSSSRNDDVEFLQSYQKKLQAEYLKGHALVERDVLGWGEVLTLNKRPKTSDAVERCARLADKYKLDGNLFRSTLEPRSCTMGRLITKLHKRIEAIPRIIAAIEISIADSLPQKDSSTTEPTLMLVGVSELAQMLNMGKSTVRKLKDQGGLPATCGSLGKHQWRLQEIENWVMADMPSRNKWDMMKGAAK